jgi:Protein of unknown function (DUF1441)
LSSGYANVEAIDAQLCSVSQISHATRRTRETVAKRLRDAGTKQSGTRAGNPVYDWRDALDAVYAVDETAQRPADLLALAKTKETEVNTALKELQLRAEMGELMQRAEVVAKLADVAKGTVQILETLGDKLERDYGLDPRQVERIHAEVAEARKAWADFLREI